MKRIVKYGVGFYLGAAVGVISDYSVINWQFWAVCLPIMLAIVFLSHEEPTWKK